MHDVVLLRITEMGDSLRNEQRYDVMSSAAEPAMLDDLSWTPLSVLSQRLAVGATSSCEIVEACLTRTDALDGRLHAYVEVYRDDAIAGAKAADLQRKAGLARGPLHGLPIALKDLLNIEGRATTAGSKSWQGRMATETSTAVERLFAAGMIGDPDPYTAVMNALQSFRVDDIVISTFAETKSGWLRADLIERVRRVSGKPVEHIVHQETANATA